MAQFSSGTPATYTPTASTTTLSHWALTVLTVGQMAKVKLISWGGDGTSLIGYVSRWARVNNTPVTAVALLIAASNPIASPMATCNTYSGTAPTGAADNNLFKQNWNVQGGGGVVVLPIGGEWFIVGGALGTAFNQIGAGNVTGADANLSNYAVQWEE
jgi:hypothetical protein